MAETALELDVVRGRAPTGWDSELGAHPAGLFHSEAWAAYRCHGGRADSLFCRWRDRQSGTVVGRAMAVQRPRRTSRAARLATKVRFESPPVGASPGTDLVEPIARWARTDRSLVEVSLGSYDAAVDWRPGGPPNASQRWEFLLDPAADVWQALSSSPRGNIRRARKTGLTAGAADDPEALLAFGHLYARSRVRLEVTKGLEAVDVEPPRFAATLGQLVERGAGRLYLARRESEPEAGCFFGVFGTSAYYLFNGSLERARDSGATPLALYCALDDLKATGITHINLGGTGVEARDPQSRDHGLYNFKRRFGGEPTLRTSGTLLTRPHRARAIRAVRRITGK